MLVRKKELVENHFIIKIIFIILPMISFHYVMSADIRFFAPLTEIEEGIALFELINNDTLNFRINVTRINNIKATQI